jgi:hypothetical protein
MNLAVRTILANQSFVAPCPPQPPKSQDEGGRAGATVRFVDLCP